MSIIRSNELGGRAFQVMQAQARNGCSGLSPMHRGLTGEGFDWRWPQYAGEKRKESFRRAGLLMRCYCRLAWRAPFPDTEASFKPCIKNEPIFSVSVSVSQRPIRNRKGSTDAISSDTRRAYPALPRLKMLTSTLAPRPKSLHPRAKDW